LTLNCYLFRLCVSKYRLSCHNLYIESGRYHTIDVNLRICPVFKNDIEDEYHFILKCPAYNDLRLGYLKTLLPQQSMFLSLFN